MDSNDVRLQLLADTLFDNDTKAGTIKGMSPEVQSSHKIYVVEGGSKYLRLNMGGSGHFMVNRETEMVYSIKAYGVPNLKKPRGTVDYLTGFVQECTRQGKGYIQQFWYDLHHIEKVDGQFDLQRFDSRSGQANLIYANAAAKKQTA